MKIAFAHNVFNRFKTLNETIIAERNVFPDANVFIACNSYINDMFFSQIKNSLVRYYIETPKHKIGCVNGLLLSCNLALQNDFDVLIFSHDDVRLNSKYLEVVMRNIGDILNNKYDIVFRNPESYGDEYAMMEIVYMSRKAVELLFSNITLLKHESEIGYYLKTKSICPELWFYNKIKNTDLNLNIIKYANLDLNTYNNKMLAQMGFEHLNAGIRGWSD